MPIYGASKRTPEQSAFVPSRPTCLGKIWLGTPRQEVVRKGQKEYHSGSDLKSKIRFDGKTDAINDIFKRHYGSLVVPEIRFYFFYPTTDEAWNCSREEWASGRGLIRRCNWRYIEQEQVRIEGKNTRGQTTYRWSQRYYKPDEKPCPYAYDQYNPKPDCPTCNFTGRLCIYIREFYDSGWQGMVLLENQSVHNVSRLSDHLRQKEEELRNMGGDLRSSPIFSPETQGLVPWVLKRYPEQIHKPVTAKGATGYAQTGDRVRGEAWLLTVDIDQNWWVEMRDRLRQQAMILPAAPQAAALPESQEPSATELDAPFWKQVGKQANLQVVKHDNQDSAVFEIEVEPISSNVLSEEELRRELKEETDRLIDTLGWDTAQSKQFLMTNFQLIARSKLSLDQYIEFRDRLAVRVSEMSGQ